MGRMLILCTGSKSLYCEEICREKYQKNESPTHTIFQSLISWHQDLHCKLTRKTTSAGHLTRSCSTILILILPKRINKRSIWAKMCLHQFHTYLTYLKPSLSANIFHTAPCSNQILRNFDSCCCQNVSVKIGGKFAAELWLLFNYFLSHTNYSS